MGEAPKRLTIRDRRTLRSGQSALPPNRFPGGLKVATPTFKAAGRALWDSMFKALPPDWEFDPREVASIEAAARQMDLNSDLEVALAITGVSVTGSRGQPVVNPIAAELRQGRLAVARLLGEVGIPDAEAAKAETAATKRGRRAAEVRWASERRKQGAGGVG